MSTNLSKQENFPVRCTKFGIALSWDRNTRRSKDLDLDLQAVAFDSSGKLLDAVYYNNLKALGKGLTHSGDEATGEKCGFDEVVWVYLDRLAATVQCVVFVVACHTGGHLKDAQNGKFHVLENGPGNETAQFRLESSSEEVDLVGAMLRTQGGWVFRVVDVPAQDGQHFVDILEPTIGNFIRSVIPGAPRRIKGAFAMEKGSVVDLPKTSEIKSVSAGLGWDTGKGQVDLDVSAIMLDDRCAVVDTIFFGNLSGQGVQHSGDNLTGQGGGDDEVITVSLDGVQPKVAQIFFVINIYTRGRSFAQVANPYCRLFDKAGEEMCMYKLAEAGREQGLMMARLFREKGDQRWGFQAIGVPCRGSMWQDSMPSVSAYAQKSPRELQPPDSARPIRRSATDQVTDDAFHCGTKGSPCVVQ
mmetsp:Transcript_34638/g.99536  ORF Transcript_34638/g.99536 Transcript_34638/m.99536 type:complete len:414 (+) Transcript_34638:107-1348(+)